MTNNEPILLVNDLTYRYPDGHQALNSVSFSVCQGERIGIIGANGAGKSTLLLLLCGLIQGTAGSVHIQEVAVSPKTFKQIAPKLGVVFQNADDQLFTSSVYDDVAFGPLHSGMGKEAVHERVTKALEATGTSHLSSRPPQKLSGGEKRSVAIATAIVQDPELLILDEPTTGLDPRARRSLISLLGSFEHTQMITSHDLDFIQKTCQKVILLHKGRIAKIGSPSEILEDEALLLACDL